MADSFIKLLLLFNWNKTGFYTEDNLFRIINSRVGTCEGRSFSKIAEYMLFYVIPKVAWLTSSGGIMHSFWSIEKICNFPGCISKVCCLLLICQNFKQVSPRILMLKYALAPISSSKSSLIYCKVSSVFWNARKGVENYLNMPALGTENRMT